MAVSLPAKVSFTIIVIAQHGERFATLTRDTHEGLIGVDAGIATLQTLRIFSHPSNRIALEQELVFLSSLRPDDPMADYHQNSTSDYHWNTASEHGRRPPFPFINTCLSLGMKSTFRNSLIMEQFGALGVLDALHASSEMKSYRYRTRFPKPTDCDTAIIDITDLDRLKYCFAANDHTTEDALTYLARISYPPTEKQRLLQCQRVAYALAKFEVIENIRVLPGPLSFHNLALPVGSSKRDAPRRLAAKSLIDLCIAKLPELFQSNKILDINHFETLDMPHIIPSIWEYCVENASTLAKAPCHVSAWVLALALRGKTCINLALFRDLAPVVARYVLRSIPEARIINLSGTAAMAAHEIEETMNAIDHDLDALYLLTPPHDVVEKLPKEIMRALKNWNHKCSKVLISSVLAEGPGQGFPKRFPPAGVLHPLVWSSTHHLSSRSFPITQMIYQSSYGNFPVSHLRYILAHVFIAGGLVAPFRLWKSILKTIKDMHLSLRWEELEFTRSLIHHLALGPPTPDSDDYLEVRSVPMEASFAVYDRLPLPPVYSGAGFHLCDLTPDAWTAVVLRDEIPKDPLPVAGSISWITTNRFRIVLLRPKQAIPVGVSQSISTAQFEFMAPPSSPNPHSSAADYVLEHIDTQTRTVVQTHVGLHEIADAIAVMQKVLDAAATVRGSRESLKQQVNW